MRCHSERLQVNMRANSDGVQYSASQGYGPQNAFQSKRHNQTQVITNPTLTSQRMKRQDVQLADLSGFR